MIKRIVALVLALGPVVVRRLVALAVVVALTPAPAFAQSFRESLAAEARKFAQNSPPATKPNPYKMTSFVLMGGGAAVFVLGLMQDRGVQVTATGASATAKETGGSKTALTVLGAAAMGGGGFLYWRGEQKRKQPSIAPMIRLSSSHVTFGSVIGF